MLIMFSQLHMYFFFHLKPLQTLFIIFIWAFSESQQTYLVDLTSFLNYYSRKLDSHITDVILQ